MGSSEILKTALEASLDQLDDSGRDTLLIEGSPLREVDPNFIDEVLDHINQNLVAGTPEKITDEKLKECIQIYRAQAVNWVVQEREKATTSKGRRKTIAQAVDIDL